MSAPFHFSGPKDGHIMFLASQWITAQSCLVLAHAFLRDDCS